MYDDPSYLAVTKEIPNVWPTLLSREAMKCNTQTYQKIGECNDTDLFHYDVKDLSLDDVIIINNMMLDRVYCWMGFDESSKIVRSLNVYSMIKKEFQRKDYDKLIKYLYQLGYDFPKTQKFAESRDKLTCYSFTDEEMKYIKYYYNLIKKN